jgi:hypothetical protein
MLRRLAHPQKHRLTSVAWRDPALEQSAPDDGPADPEILGEALHRLAGEVLLDEIVRVDVQSFRGHVFNLETSDGLYLAEGIVTHNCRCSVSLKQVGEEEPAGFSEGRPVANFPETTTFGPAF